MGLRLLLVCISVNSDSSAATRGSTGSLQVHVMLGGCGVMGTNSTRSLKLQEQDETISEDGSAVVGLCFASSSTSFRISDRCGGRAPTRPRPFGNYSYLQSSHSQLLKD